MARYYFGLVAMGLAALGIVGLIVVPFIVSGDSSVDVGSSIGIYIEVIIGIIICGSWGIRNYRTGKLLRKLKRLNHTLEERQTNGQRHEQDAKEEGDRR